MDWPHYFYGGLVHFFTLVCYIKFNLNGGIIIKITSKITGKIYEGEDVRYIPNMLQNYKYLNSTEAFDDLLDVICGSDNKLVFVWKKTEKMNELYDKWCKREL